MYTRSFSTICKQKFIDSFLNALLVDTLKKTSLIALADDFLIEKNIVGRKIIFRHGNIE